MEVPVTINFQDWRFQVGAGLSYGRLMSYSAEDFTGVDITDTQNYSNNIISYLADATFYFNPNLGFNIRWAKTITDFQAVEGGNQLIGRTVSIRAFYFFNAPDREFN